MTYTELHDKLKKANPEFLEEAVALSPEDLHARLAQFAKDASAVDDSRDEDADLSAAKELTKELAAPYSDASKAIKLKIKFVVALLKEKGIE